MTLNPDLGKQAEYACASKLLGMGLTPCWPSSESQPYDMIVDTINGPKRIQVKGAFRQGQSFEAPLRMRAGKGTKRKYTKKEIDFVAFYVFTFDAWYIFPIEEVYKRVTVRPANPDCKYNKYLEAWNLLDSRLSKG